MKLNRVNKNGSLSIILPRALTKENNWQEGEEVSIIAHTLNCLLIEKNAIKSSKETILKELKNFIKVFEKCDIDYTKRDLLRNILLSIIEKI